jgi:zinc protease
VSQVSIALPTRTVLDNGLVVVLREMHTVPVVSSWLWYRVGSRDEPTGMTGAAHWLEHMMFKGTPKYPKGSLDKLIARNGGLFNAFTSVDYTCYFETLPAAKLDLALEIEADRMVNATFDPDEFEAERTVVISEREGLENQPEFLLAEEVAAVAFHAHPYGHQVIGWKGDLQRLTRDDIFAMYRSFYAPNNAILAVAGDLESTRALERIHSLFGSLPPSTLPRRLQVDEPPQRDERRVVLRQAGPTAYLHMAYHAPQATHPDATALMVLDAILSGAKPMTLSRGTSNERSARLYRALVESEVAAEATSDYTWTVDPGLFTLEVTLRPGRDPAEAEEILREEIRKLIEEGVLEAELSRTRKQIRAQLAYSLESVANQAYWLGFFELLDSYERLLSFEERIASVTAEDVQRVAATYLRETNCTIGYFLPTGTSSAASARPMAPAFFVPCYRTGTGPNWPGPETIQRAELANGATVLAHRNPAAPSLVILADVKAGAVLDPPGKHGLAAFTSRMLERGTGRRSFRQLNEELDGVGASLRAAAGGHTAGLVAKSLVEDRDLLVDILTDVITNPAFPPEEVRKLRGEVIAELRELDDHTGSVAMERFRRLLYPPEHPYRYRVPGYVDTVESLTVEDIRNFYSRYYDPRNLILVVVGDIEPQEAIELLARGLSCWQPCGEPVSWNLPEVKPPAVPQQDAVVMPDKSQVDIAWGFLGLRRTDPDYYAAHLLDVIWGQLGLMGRLGEHVRDELGLAYYVYSRLEAGYFPGPWVVRAGVNPARVPKALRAIEAEARKLRQEPVSAEELADAKAYLVGSLPLRLETNEALAAAIMSMEEFALGLDYLLRYETLIGAVTSEQLLAVAQRYIVPERAILALAGPQVSIEEGS